MSVISGMLQASAAKKAAKAQERAAAADLKFQKEQAAIARADAMPYMQLGYSALPIYQDSMGLNGEAGYKNALAKFQTSPGYQYQLDQGVRALENSSAAGGKLFSGQTGMAITGFGQNLANREWNTWQDRLFGNINLGANAASGNANIGLGYARNVSNAYDNIGAAKASGYIGAANGWSNALAGLSQIAGFALGGGFGGGATGKIANYGSGLGGGLYGVRP